jgi:hypothetical protein
MSLPTKAIDRLFERMAATYLGQWTRQFEHVPVADAKTAWAHELAQFAGRLEAVAWALENLPPKVPNVIEFKAICRAAPMPEAPRLPEPKADPQKLAQELAKLADIKRATKAAQMYDAKEWARRIIARHKAGDRIRPITLRFANEALRTHLEAAT